MRGNVKWDLVKLVIAWAFGGGAAGGLIKQVVSLVQQQPSGLWGFLISICVFALAAVVLRILWNSKPRLAVVVGLACIVALPIWAWTVSRLNYSKSPTHATSSSAHPSVARPVPNPSSPPPVSRNGTKTSPDVSRKLQKPKNKEPLPVSTATPATNADADQVQLFEAPGWDVTTSFDRFGATHIEYTFILSQSERVFTLGNSSVPSLRLYFNRNLTDADVVTAIDPLNLEPRKSRDHLTIDPPSFYGHAQRVSFKIDTNQELRFIDIREAVIP